MPTKRVEKKTPTFADARHLHDSLTVSPLVESADQIRRAPRSTCNTRYASVGPFIVHSVAKTFFFFLLMKQMTHCVNKSLHQSTTDPGETHLYPNKYAKSGVTPSVPSQTSASAEMRELAKHRPQETEIIRDHLRRQDKNADPRKAGDASRARAAANCSTNSRPLACRKESDNRLVSHFRQVPVVTLND